MAFQCIVTASCTSYFGCYLFEAGHGKSAADAVGGVLKRSADSAVDHGDDIPDAQTFYDIIKDRTKVKLFFVDEKAIDSVAENIPIGLKPVAHTMKLHQIGLEEIGVDGKLWVRTSSCVCSVTTNSVKCACYRPESVHMQLPENRAASPELVSGKEIAVKITMPKSSTSILVPVLPTDTDIIGKWCIVLYNMRLYPGEILERDQDAVFVSVLSPIGENKFVKPVIPDELWYKYTSVLGYIEKPVKKTSRSRFSSINQEIWDNLI